MLLIMDTTEVSEPRELEDHEEGEIIDENVFEQVSSEEEENLRERIRQLETRNQELEKLAALAKQERKQLNYVTDLVNVSSDEEFFEASSPGRKRRHVSREARRRPKDRVKRAKRRKSKKEDLDRDQLDAALRHGDNGARKELSLSKKLRLQENSNKENDTDEDDELTALRLQALKSKQEVRELMSESPSVEMLLNSRPENEEPDDTDEQELRIIALKSAMMKKAETRKAQKERPYSPTDTLTAVAAGSDVESNMEISPSPSPTLEDAVLQPIDMEIATPDETSNSPPTFYSYFDPTSIPPSQITDPSYAKPLDARRRSLHDSLDDEESALRSLLLAKMKPKVTKSLPASPLGAMEEEREEEPSKTDNQTIESNLKKAALRLKELTEQERSVIDANLNKIIGEEGEREGAGVVNLKEVVERLKNKAITNGGVPETSKELNLNVKNTAEIPPEATKANPRFQQAAKETAKVSDASKRALEVKENSNSQNLGALSKLKPAQITSSMTSLLAASKFRKAPPQLPAPVIMKRKVKTNSSIINVPFKPQPKPPPKLPQVTGPSTSKTDEFVAKPVPKLVIQLGYSSSSDEELDTWMSQQPSPVPRVDQEFEKRLDQFLKQARAKTEQSQATKAPVTEAKPGDTPNALRHLPMSSQIEYKKLIAKMRQLEKQRELQKQRRQVSKPAPKSTEVTIQQPPKPPSPEPVPVVEVQCKKKPSKADLFKLRLQKFSDEQKKQVVQKAEENFNNHSSEFLSDLGDFISKIDNVTSEKEAQVAMETEVTALRSQLEVAETKLAEQKRKVSKMLPEITKTHKSILSSRDKYLKLSKCCIRVGQLVEGESYQFQNLSKTEIFQKLKVLSVKTGTLKSLGKKLRAVEDRMEEDPVVQEPREDSREILEYKSPLDCLETESKNDPDGVLCPFDMTGECSDTGCKYLHLNGCR